MQAGKLDKLLTIQRATTAQNDYGEPVETWATWKQAWAQLRPLSGRELELSRVYAATVSHEVRIRYIEGLQPTDRLKHEPTGRIFSIDGILNVDEQNREYQIFSTEVINR